MVVKLIKRETRKSNENGIESVKIISEFYEGKSVAVKDEFIILNNDINIMLLTEYGKCEITNDEIETAVIEAYIMNDNGQTIERIK